MSKLWMDAFWLAFVFVTGFSVIFAAVGGIVVAGWSAGEYTQNRGAGPIDWHDITLALIPRRASHARPFGRPVPRGQEEYGFAEKGESSDSTYRQEELQF